MTKWRLTELRPLTLGLVLWGASLAGCRESPKPADPAPEPPRNSVVVANDVTPTDAPAAASPTDARSSRAPTRPAPPSLWSRVDTWPEVLATVDGTPVIKKDLVKDLQQQMETGVLANDVDHITGLRAAATALEARVDALIVARAVTPADKAAVAKELARLQKFDVDHAGGREPWLVSLKRRGLTEAARGRTLEMRAGLNVLTEKSAKIVVTDAELRERYDGLHKMMRPSHPQAKESFGQAKPSLLASVRQMRLWEQGQRLLIKLRGTAKVERVSPFDRPPGGLPMAGDVTMAEFEEDDD